MPAGFICLSIFQCPRCPTWFVSANLSERDINIFDVCCSQIVVALVAANILPSIQDHISVTANVSSCCFRHITLLRIFPQAKVPLFLRPDLPLFNVHLV
jgi:hypothetical protein